VAGAEERIYLMTEPTHVERLTRAALTIGEGE